MAFVRSNGVVSALEYPPSSPMHSLGYSAGSTSIFGQTYGWIYRTQPQVRTVVSFLARNIAQLGLHTFQRLSDTNRVRLTDHPMAELLGAPSPRTTRYRLVYGTVADLAIYDIAFWWKIADPDTGALQLARLKPQAMRPEGDLDGWTYQGSKGEKFIPADQIVYFRGYNPDDDRLGSSPIDSLRTYLIDEFNASRYREQLWKNGARFSGYITRPAEAPKWSPGAKKNFKESWRSQYTGDGPGAGGTPVLEDGMNFTPAAITPEQAQYIESRKLTREEVAAAYFIPPPMVGILEHATFSNIQEQHRNLYQDTIGPWLEQITQEIELQLLPDLPPTKGVYVEFNLAAKLNGSFEEQAAATSSAVGAPWMTRNEARARQNLPQIEGGDELVTPLNVLEGGQASPQDSAPDPVDLTLAASHRGVRVKARPDEAFRTKQATVFSGFFTRQGSAISSKLGAKLWRKEAVEEVFDDDRWNEELAAILLAMGLAGATEAGRKALAVLGLDPGDYDEARTVAWLTAHAEGVAEGINATTKAELADALTKPDPRSAVKELFDGYRSERAAQLATSETTASAGFGSTEAVRQTGREAVKTWRVTSSNPRPEHSALNGKTIPLDDVFSVGGHKGRWPGDSALPTDMRANCSCDLTISISDG